jgi:hypothetical protein
MDNGRAVLDNRSRVNGSAMSSRRDPGPGPGQPPRRVPDRPAAPRRSRFWRVSRAIVITCLIVLIGFILGLIAGAISGVI